jgi:hypothetical protein
LAVTSAFDSGFKELSQIALERLLSGRFSICSEPVFEIPDANSVLDLGFLDSDRNRRILMDRVHPIVLAEEVQSAAYSLIKTARCDFDHVFRAVRVETRSFASSETHAVILAFRFSFATNLTASGGKV